MGDVELVERPRSLRIGMISYYLPTGSKIGVGYQVDALARELVSRGHTVEVFSECPPDPELPYVVRQVRLSGGLRTFRFALALQNADFSSFDVIHAHGDDYWLWRRRVRAHLRTMHGSCFEEAIHITGLLERLRMFTLGLTEVLATAVADETILVSPATRRWTPWVRRVVPNGVDLHHFHPDATARAAHPVVLFVGTWNGRKRGRELAAAFTEHVRPRIPTAELWMITRDAPERVPDGVVVLGRVSHDRLAELYRNAWVFCLPSSYEGFGIPYVEALASGTPIVATPNVGSNYILATGAGLLAPLSELGPTLARLINNKDEMQRLSRLGLERATDFSLESVATAYEDLYYRHIAKRDSVPATDRTRRLTGHG